MTQIDHTEYPKSLRTKCMDSLIYIRQDAHNAMTANPEGHKAGYYADEINYIGDEIRRRKVANRS